MTTANNTTRTTATPISGSVIGENVPMMPLTPELEDVLVWVEDKIDETTLGTVAFTWVGVDVVGVAYSKTLLFP